MASTLLSVSASTLTSRVASSPRSSGSCSLPLLSPRLLLLGAGAPVKTMLIALLPDGRWEW